MLNRAAVLATALLVISSIAISGVVLGSQAGAGNADDTAVNATPGEMLTGVVEVQEAELNGKIQSRAFGIQLAKAASDEAKAEIVAEQLSDIKTRLQDLNQTLNTLQAARANGSLQNGTWAIQVAVTAAKVQSLNTMLQQTQNAAEDLPADLLEEKGINATAIQKLANDAQNMTGEQVAKVAQTIAGPSVGLDKAEEEAGNNVPDDAPPDDVPPDQSQSTTSTTTTTTTTTAPPTGTAQGGTTGTSPTVTTATATTSQP